MKEIEVTEEIVIQTNAEKILRTVAKIVLFIGVLIGILSVILGRVNLLVGLVAGAGSIFLSFIIWALLNVIANISAKLSVIANYCEEQQIKLESNEDTEG